MRIQLIGFAALFASCSSSSTGAAGAPPFPATRVAYAFDRLNGTPITLGELRGRVIVLTVFTTWVDAAIVEVPRLQALRANYPQKEVEIIAAALDEDKKMVGIFAKTFEVTYTVVTVPDRAELASPSGPFGEIRILPTSFLIDREGRIAARMEGTWPEGVLERAVRQLVAADDPRH